ncbi:MAG: ATP-binding cassette domain-containing protein [Ignavibacteriales bacterium]|nr:ATP-binding cassette domain-containing protein [Ignavibacteriales bacterium]
MSYILLQLSIPPTLRFKMISVLNLRKQFSNVTAVDDVSFKAQRGKIFGLLGPNGAGKTTTIRLLLNILSPDDGQITFDGFAFSSALQNKIGYLPEERGLYRKSKLLNTIIYFATLKGLSESEAKKKAKEWLARFELLNYAERRIQELSKGNQQKVQFICSLLHNPEYVILDEPFSGLDPVNQLLMREIFLEQRKAGKVVIFSTHIMEHAEKLCDELILINKGKIVLDGTVSEAKKRFGKNAIYIEFDGDGSFLSSMNNVAKCQLFQNYAELELNNNESPSEFLRTIVAQLNVTKFETKEPSLYSIFLELVGNDSTEFIPKQSELGMTSNGRVVQK